MACVLRLRRILHLVPRGCAGAAPRIGVARTRSLPLHAHAENMRVCSFLFYNDLQAILL